MRYRRSHVAGATYFFALVTERRRPLFDEPACVAHLLTAIEKVRSRHPFSVDAYVILPDHLHALWTLPEGGAKFSTRWRLIKEASTRAYLKAHAAPERNESRRNKGEQAIWQRRSWEHLVRDDDDFARHLDYIHLNPVHHGLTSAPREWPHSSFAAWVERGVYEAAWGSDALPQLPEWAKRHE